MSFRGGRRRNHFERREGSSEDHTPVASSSGAGRRRRSRAKKRATPPQCSDPPPVTQEQDDDDDDDDDEIPGFYYDKEKRKYFQILPGHNTNAGVVTREKLNAKNEEEKRQKDLLSSDPNNRRVKSNILKILHCTSSGNISNAQRETLRWTHAGLKPRGYSEVDRDSNGPYEKIEHFKSLLLNPKRDKIVALWPVAGMISQRLQMLDISDMNFTNDDHSLRVGIQPIGNSVLHSFNRVTHMTWAPFNDNTENNILYTTISVMGNNSSFAMIRNLSLDTISGFSQVDFNLGKVSTWSCAWNSLLKRFSVGTEKCALLLDVETRRLWELFTDRSDVLAQTFTTDGPQVLLNGTRSGVILGHDLRSASTRAVFSLKHPTSVCHLKFRSDENYLCAADFSGKIKMWDLRQRKTVMTFNDLQNECSALPFHIDEEDDVLYAAGHDCYSKLWSLSTGHLLHSIPPPFPASRRTIPSLLYSSNLKAYRGCPMLLLGMKNRIHVYSI